MNKHPPSSHLLVLMQLIGIALCCVPIGFKNLGNTYWLILCVLGAALGIVTLCFNKIGNFSVYPELNPLAKLITSGPYKTIRHPMYTSLIIMMVGIALYNFHWLNGLGLAMVVLAVVNKAKLEERLLTAKFPDYSEHQQRTKRFIPAIY